jgi:hypothetical protein
MKARYALGVIAVALALTVPAPAAQADWGWIHVVKDAQPNDPQDFTFTTGGGASPAMFQLDDDGDSGNALANDRWLVVAPGSGYTVNESPPATWTLTSATCSDGSPTFNIDVSAGEVVTCTFVNRSSGSITVVKDSQPDDPQAFTFNAGGGLSPASFQLDDDGSDFSNLPHSRTFNGIAAHSGYSVSESVPPGWEQVSATCSDGSPPSNIDVSPLEDVTCTFTNRKAATIVVIKDALPDDPQDFDFTAGGGLTPSAFQLDDDGDESNGTSSIRTFDNVTPGTGYSISESPLAGWAEGAGTCSDGSPPGNIDAGAGETVTCTFVNRRQGTVTALLDTQPDDPADFSFTAGGGLSPAGFQLDDDGDSSNGLSNARTFTDVDPGSGYSLAAAEPPGWIITAATCSDGSDPSNIDVAPAENVTCTFVATPQGRIVVRKDAQPNDAQDFGFTTGGGIVPASFALDDDGNEGNGLPSSRSFIVSPGAGYSIAEQAAPSPWTQASASCSDGSAPSNIDVAAGETVTCTFVNSAALARYARPRGATPLYAPLVPAYQACSAANRVHAAPLSFGSCNPPVQSSTTVWIGSPDANGAVASMMAWVKLRVVGTGSTADVQLSTSLNDLRCKPTATTCGSANAADGPDYTGELRLRATLRATDRLNPDPSSAGDAGTTSDIVFGPTVPCVSSPETTVGGNCALTTTVNTLIPGAVVGGTRSVWQFDQIAVDDGGPDGDGDTTGDNETFAVQGIFAP